MTEPLLRGRYRLGETLGSGAQGDVRIATDVRHDRRVAIKSRRGPDAVVLTEARVLYDLQPHPNLPLLREDFTHDDRVYLVMDYIEGTDLASMLQAGPLTIDEVIEVLTPVAAALDHLHAHLPPIVHGDVKPANIVRSSEGRIVLVDLGLVGSVGAGTLGFRAPERTHAPAGPTADVYSLAATAYALLTGRAPGPGGFAPMPKVPPARAERVRAVLEWGLQLVEDRRPRRASHLVESLAGVASHRNLPVPITTFVGREEELATLDRLLRSERLVTIVGPGGAGKTRLAIEAAGRSSPTSGLVFVDLVPVRAGVAHHLLRELGEDEIHGEPAEIAARLLAADPRMVILDNAEHLLDEVASLCMLLTSRCPDVGFLVTSREPLGVAGESILRLGGLPTTVVAGPSPAAQLILTRLRGAAPRTPPTREEIEAASHIANRLDGLPLALELAAARAAGTGLTAFADAIEQGIDVLGRLRGAPERHSTIAAMVDHTYDLLDEPTRSALRAASLLTGGVEPSVLAQVASMDELEARTCLLRAAAASMAELDGSRFRILEPVRQRLRQHLDRDGETHACAARWATWTEGFFCAAASALHLRHDPDLLSTFEREEANLLAGLRVLVRRDHDERVYVGLNACYLAASRMSDLLSAFEEVIDERRASGAEPPPRALAIYGRILANGRLLDAARPQLEAAISLSRSTGQAHALAEALLGRAGANLQGDRSLALLDIDEVERVLAMDDDPQLQASILTTRGKILMEMGHLSAARAEFDAAERLAAAHGLSVVTAMSLRHRIIIEANAGNDPGSRDALDRLFEHTREFGPYSRLAECYLALGHEHGRHRRLDEAEAAYRQAQEIWAAAGDRRAQTTAQMGLGGVALARGDRERALFLVRQARDNCRARGDDEQAGSASMALADIARELGRLDEALEHARTAMASLAASGDAVMHGHALRAVAEIEEAEGDVRAALVTARASLARFQSGGNAPGIDLMSGYVAHLEARTASDP